MATHTPDTVAQEPLSYLPSASRRATGHRGLRAGLVALEAFTAATAIWGGAFVVPTIPMEWLRQGLITPFSDTTIPAIALGVLCGGSALAAAVAVVARPRLGALLSIVSGGLMVGFELVEILVVGFTPVMYPTQFPAWLQPLYIVIGSAVALLGARLWKAQAGSYRVNLSAL